MRRKHDVSISWFEQLFGFPENIPSRSFYLTPLGDRPTEYLHNQQQFELTANEIEPPLIAITSKLNGRSYLAGRFSTPSLHMLRSQASAAIHQFRSQNIAEDTPRVCFHHQAIGDVLSLHFEVFIFYILLCNSAVSVV